MVGGRLRRGLIRSDGQRRMVVNKDGIAPRQNWSQIRSRRQDLDPDAQTGQIDGAVTCFAYESVADCCVGQTRFYSPSCTLLTRV